MNRVAFLSAFGSRDFFQTADVPSFDAKHVLKNISIKTGLESKETTCEVNGKQLEPVPFSCELIRRVFPQNSRVLLELQDRMWELPTGKVETYYRRAHSKGKRKQQGDFIEIKRFPCDGRPGDTKNHRISLERANGGKGGEKSVIPRAQLFEINVTGNLYTYILTFSDGSYIRTPLRKKIN